MLSYAHQPSFTKCFFACSAREPFWLPRRVCRPHLFPIYGSPLLRLTETQLTSSLFSDPAVKVARAILKTARNRSFRSSATAPLKGHFRPLLSRLTRHFCWEHCHTTTNLHYLLHLKISMEEDLALDQRPVQGCLGLDPQQHRSKP